MIDRPLTAMDALDPKQVPDDKIFTYFLDWALLRKLIEGYYLVMYHQVGERQGIQTPIDRLPPNLPDAVRTIVRQFLERYQLENRIPTHQELFFDDAKIYLYKTSLSRIYDINLGMLILTTKHRVRAVEIDRFIRFMEANVSIRKQAIASTLSPPFVDLALDEPIRLDHEVGQTVVKSIEANQTIVLSLNRDSNHYETAFSTLDNHWVVPVDDPIASHLRQSNNPIYVQDTTNDTWIHPSFLIKQRSDLVDYIKEARYKSALIFDVKHAQQLFAVVVCLFARAHAVSMTEVAISTRLQLALADYYRLGFERHKAARASTEAEDVEKKARQALLIADIMHDATDDLLAARSSIDSLTPRNEIEQTELENAKRNLKHLQQTTRLFRFLFEADTRRDLDVEGAMSAGKDYYSDTLISGVFEAIEAKYRRAFESHKITLVMRAPPKFSLKCMSVSISRAIDNCVKNSIRHLKEKTHVKRRIILGAKSVLLNGVAFAEVWVEDNGPGIEPSLLDRVHKPFVSFSGGMGLGLAIVRTVCDIHGGDLNVTSEWGSWTHVSLRIPQVVRQSRKEKIIYGGDRSISR